MINTQYINLNMIPSGVMPVLYCSQYDVGRPLGVVVYNGAESVDLSGYTCTIEATRTDKTPVTAGVTTSGNIGVFETTATMTNQADTYKGKLVLTDGNGKRVASLAFVLVVTVRTMDEDAEEIEEDASLYQQYTGTVQTIIASIRADLAAEITARQNAISTEASTRAAAVSAEAAARQSADNTLQSNINAEASTRATQDASLQSQINQLIAPSGSAPSAAEVENARIGSDGTVYPTLGDAIRTQNSLLKSQLEENSRVTNIAALDAVGVNALLQYSGSIFSGGTRFSNVNVPGYTWSYMEVIPGDAISFSANAGYTCEFASAFVFPGGTTPNGSITGVVASGQTNTRIVCTQGVNTFTVPATAKYLILTRYNNSVDQTPTNFTINGLDYYTASREAIENIKGDITDAANAQTRDSIKFDTLDLLSERITLSMLPKRRGRFTNDRQWYAINASNTHSVFSVNPGDVLRFTSSPALAFLTTYNAPVAGELAPTVSGFSGLITTANVNITVPDDAKFAVIMRDFSGEDRTPDGMYYDAKEDDKMPQYPLMADMSDLAFEKQRACIHHDNFHRQITGDAWNIGTGAVEDSYTSLFPQSYYTPYTGDDGFRISDNVLINDQTITTPSVPDGAGVRLITASSFMQNEILFEMSVPDSGKRSEFVFNFEDLYNYETILAINDGSNVLLYWYKMDGGEGTSTPIFTIPLTVQSIGIQMSPNGIKLYFDGVCVDSMNYVLSLTRYEMVKKVRFNRHFPVGIRIRKAQPYQYKYIALFNVVDFSVINIGSIVDKGAVTNPFFKMYGTGTDTLLTDNTFYSEKSQEFTLIKANVTSNPDTARREYSDNTSRLRINNLRNYKIEFDVFIPSDYEYDTVSDLVFQMHDRHSVNSQNLETVPPIALITVGVENTEYWGFLVRGCDITDITPSALVNNDDNQVMEVTRGEWTHFEVIVKEGYMDGHRPVTELRINGELKYRNHAINAYNRAIGTYARYGFYKADWEDADVRAACTYDSKTVVIDNFTIKI